MKNHTNRMLSLCLVLVMLFSMASPAFAVDAVGDSGIINTATDSEMGTPTESPLPDVSPVVSEKPIVPSAAPSASSTPESSEEPSVSSEPSPSVSPSVPPVASSTPEPSEEALAGIMTENALAVASNIIAQGNCGAQGANIMWTLDNTRVLTLTGTGDMADYYYTTGTRPPWYSYNANMTSLVIGEGITSIGNYAFTNYAGLTGGLVIPDSVTKIGVSAFSNCRFTGKLIIPASVIMIGDSAFYNCSGFTGCLVIPDSVTEIGNSAFSNCRFTGDLIISNNVTSIGDSAFYNCTGFTGDLVIPDSVTTIGNYAFYKCKGFTGNLTISDGVTRIGDSAFSDCAGFTGDLVIPDSVTEIGDSAFYMCQGFTGNLTISDGVTMIGATAFNGCLGFTGDLIIPNSVIKIGTGAFAYCRGFTGDLVIPDSVTRIERDAFNDCSGFTGDLVIPDSVTEIGDNAFYKCKGFTGNLTISDGVTMIGATAFNGCLGFTGDLIIPNSVIKIGTGAFANCSGFTGNLVISNNVTEIGNSAFYNCSGFTGDLVIPDSVTEIGVSAFNNCSGFTGTLIISNNVTKIWYNAFSNCTGFTGDLVIPDSVIMIGDSAFSNCTGFTGDLVIPNSVTRIETNVFNNCSGFTGKLIIPDSVTTIGMGAFNNCSGFTGKLIIPDSVTEIGNNAFFNCSGFTGDLVIPDSVTAIGMGTFHSCKGFTGDLVIPDSVTRIGNYAFNNCSGFTGKLIIPDSVTVIGEYAFAGCLRFTGNLVIPDSVTTIGDNAFGQLTNIDAICVRGAKDSIIGAPWEYFGSVIWDAKHITLDHGYEYNSAGEQLESLWIDGTKGLAMEPVRSGWVFDGWNLDATGSMPYVLNTPIANDCEMWATWSVAEVAYEVQYYQSDAVGNYGAASSSKPLSGIVGTSVTADRPDIIGFVFDAEKTGSGDTGIIMADGSLVLKVYYKRLQFHVFLDYANGQPAGDMIVGYDISIGTLPVASKAGYDFTGWFDGANQLIDASYKMPNQDISLTAKYIAKSDTTYAIQHWQEGLDGIYVLADIERLAGVTDTAVSAAAKTYDGFAENQSHADRVVSGNIQGDGSLVLNLYYTRLSYNVVFNIDDDTTTPEQTVKFKGHATEPTNLAKPGYVLDGWYTDKTWGTKVIFNIFPVVSDTTLYARWTARDDINYEVQYYQQDIVGDGYTRFETDALTGTTDTVANASIKTYTGFHENKGHSDRVITGSISPDGSLVLKVYYDRDVFKLAFDSNGGSAVPEQTGIRYYSVITAPVSSKLGYNFAGWYSDAAMTTAYDFANPVIANANLFAKFTPVTDMKYVTEHYVQNKDKTGYKKHQTDELSGMTASTATAQALGLYGFVENQSHADRVATAEILPDGSTVLKLFYDRVDYTVSFESNGGTAIGSGSIAYENSIAKPVDPDRTGYVFAGWYSDEVFANAFDFSMAITSDIMLYAKWTPASGVTYVIEYYQSDADGAYGTAISSKQLSGTTGETVSAVTPDIDGFAFDAEKTGDKKSGNIKADGSLVLAVYYKRLSYKVNFDYANGEADSSATIAYDMPVALPAASKVGYDFLGWFAADDSQVQDGYKMPSHDVSLTAKYAAKSDTVYTVQHWQEGLDGVYTLVNTENLTGVTDMVVNAVIKIENGFVENLTHENRLVSGNIKGDGSLVLSVYYARLSYNVNFDYANGEAAGSIAVSYDAPVTLPAASKAGYDFLGWFASDDSQVQDGYKMPSHDVSLTAKYAAKSDTVYTVQHWQEGLDGVYVLVNTENLTGATDMVVNAVIKTENGFVENLTHENRLVSGNIKGDGSLVLAVYYARLSYNVNFDYANGEAAGSIAVSYDAPVTLPAASKAGYDFLGWFASDDSQVQDGYKMPSHDVSLTAKYAAKSDTVYTVQHWQEGLDGVYTLVNTENLTGATDMVVNAVIKTENGFVENLTHENRLVSGNIKGDGSLVLAVYYARLSYAVNFDTKGSSEIAGQTVKFNGQITKPADPVKIGWVFDGWWLDENYQTEVLFDTFLVTGDISIYAKWVPAQDVKYAIEHYQQTVDGTSYTLFNTDAFAGVTGSMVQATAAIYYGFVENDKHADRVSEITIQPDGSSVMKLFYDRLSYTISFESNGGSAVSPVSAVYQGQIEAPANPTKTGYEFAGWYLDGIYSKPVDVTAIRVTENITLYAKWSTSDGTAYKIQYYLADLAGQYNLVSTEAMTGETGVTVRYQTRTVDGYIMNPDAPDSVLSGIIMADGSLVLKVYYDRVQFKITIDPANGETVTERQVKFEALLGQLPVVTKKDCEFAGWYDAEGRIVTESSIVTKNMAVTAHWTEKPVVIPPTPPSGGGGGSSVPSVYEIVIKTTSGGRVDPDKSVIELSGGRSQLVKIIPDAGYVIKDVIVDGQSKGAVAQYAFEKVRENHVLEVKFEQASAEHDCHIDEYDDVDMSTWYHEAFDWAVVNGYFQGITDKTLSPMGTLSRAQAAMVIARMHDYQSDAGLGDLMTKPVFSDVALGAWHAEAIHWDDSKAYMFGYSDGRFGPEDALTREQMALVLYRLAGMPAVSSDIKKKFGDTASISAWASDAMYWAVQTGIIMGDDKNYLKPLSPVTRAEAAAMFQRFEDKR